MTAERILVVDDDVDLCEELADALKEEGYDTSYTSDVDEAKRLIKQRRYDILLLDYKMPGPGGIGILKMIQAEGLDMKVMIVSGRPFVDRALKEEGLLGMVSAIVPKPIDFEALLGIIRNPRGPHSDAGA